jgi:hypothetical protein
MEQHKEELTARQEEISLRNAMATATLDMPVDLTGSEEVSVVPAGEDDDVSAPVQIAPESAMIRIACDLEHVTIGQGTPSYEFKEGQTYRVPMNVALHLHNLGYVWQWL